MRQSLYDECNKWTKAIGKHRRYMGGDKPNLADLVLIHAFVKICTDYPYNFDHFFISRFMEH